MSDTGNPLSEWKKPLFCLNSVKHMSDTGNPLSEWNKPLVWVIVSIGGSAVGRALGTLFYQEVAGSNLIGYHFFFIFFLHFLKWRWMFRVFLLSKFLYRMLYSVNKTKKEADRAKII